jgi:uncharacterized protein
MNVHEINRILGDGEGHVEPLLSNWFALQSAAFRFPFEFGLDELPEQAGLIIIRGARQYGKSTWLEGEVLKSFVKYGPGSTFYLNGDAIANHKELESELARLLRRFHPSTKVKRVFIDEISAIDDWQLSLKILWDSGLSRDTLIITTGSMASDLRHGSEMLPGRRGKLARTNYLFTPISFQNFYNLSASHLDSEKEILAAYIISGGSPLSCHELLTTGKIPPYVTQLVRDWILGNFTASGRSRANVIALIDTLCRVAMSPTSQDKIARESGLANNTSAAQYMEQLMDLLSLAQADNFDVHKKRRNPRKPSKYQFINTLVPLSFGADNLTSIKDFLSLEADKRGKWYEWVVAQELWRRSGIAGAENPEFMRFWQSEKNEVDFFNPPDLFIEVKSGAVNPRDFDWFSSNFPNKILTIVGDQSKSFGPIRCVRLLDFLLERDISQ